MSVFNNGSDVEDELALALAISASLNLSGGTSGSSNQQTGGGSASTSSSSTSSGGGSIVPVSALAATANAPDALPLIRVIDFDIFKQRSEFPRYPENKDLCVDVRTIDRDDSLVVFISHCWLRGWPGADGYDKRPHPDNASADKFKLCVEGISKAFNIYAPGAKKCYLWLDFGCMDQDGNPAGELKQLDEIVRNADCIFTPIHGENKNAGKPVTNWYIDYAAAAWNEGEFSYTHRGWCRVEMLYAANIPLIEDKARAERCFQLGFKTHVLNGVRPHLLYGTSQKLQTSPIILPPLRNSFYDQLDPLKGHLSVKADRLKIEELVGSLKPYFKTVFNIGYEGGRDSSGLMSGFGIMWYKDGKVYEGNWANDKKNGYGEEKYSSGNSYEGNFVDDMKSGHGTSKYADGNSYEGNWSNGLMSGHGTFKFIDGSSYEGNWADNLKSGHGSYKFSNGDSHEGNYFNDLYSGHGTYKYANGDSYEGNWANDMMNGFGTMMYADGRPSKSGNWVNGKFEG